MQKSLKTVTGVLCLALALIGIAVAVFYIVTMEMRISRTLEQIQPIPTLHPPASYVMREPVDPFKYRDLENIPDYNIPLPTPKPTEPPPEPTPEPTPEPSPTIPPIVAIP